MSVLGPRDLMYKKKMSSVLGQIIRWFLPCYPPLEFVQYGSLGLSVKWVSIYREWVPLYVGGRVLGLNKLVLHESEILGLVK